MARRRLFSVRAPGSEYEYEFEFEFEFESDPSLSDERNAPKCWSSNSNSSHHDSTDTPPAVVYPNMVTEEEADVISSEILKHRMRRRRYEKGHWDSVITGFREIELYDIHELLEARNNNDNADEASNAAIIARAFGRIRDHLEEQHLSNYVPISWLPCHAIDLKKEGELRAHVDSVRFSGHLVAGLSLLSPAIMRLKYPPADDDDDDDEKRESEPPPPEGHVDLYLPPRSLYVLKGVGRFGLSHELLPDGAGFCGDNGESITVARGQRLSIIFRDAKQE